ncbi:uncharacterized protein LOC121863594 [Homarus americanus]|uniref:uncharacterized protein LOC121863594 n=1 Tax=Homarus americanus TaxID=6706 RepID=UPI001C46790C|nr:uncharacterized protein LOC121863594 [Homarus americanus]
MAPCIRWNLLVLVMSVFIVEGRARSLQNPVSSTLPEENTAALGNLLAKVVGQELDGCYLVVITAGVHQTSNVFTPIVRSLAKGYLPGVLVDVSLTTPGRHSPLLHHLRKGDGRFSCRVYLLDLISSNSMANENSDLLR